MGKLSLRNTPEIWARVRSAHGDWVTLIITNHKGKSWLELDCPQDIELEVTRNSPRDHDGYLIRGRHIT